MIWECEKCGHTADVPIEGAITCKCGFVDLRLTEETLIKDSFVPPGVLARGLNYANSWVRWTSHGRPTRTDEQVEELRGICRSCTEFFDGEICTHKSCGCKVAKGSWFGDKLKWTTEHCPINKW
jgi:hypothetical protein